MPAQRRKRQSKRDLSNLAGLRVGLYCRVSQADPDNPDPREKSTQDQEAVGRKWAEQVGAQVVDVYSDEGVSASRFTDKERAEYNRLIEDVETGKLDVLWFWEQSRLSRRQAEYFHLVDLCRNKGVLWVNQDRVIDPSDYKDTLAPGIMASIDAISSEQTSERVRRGMESIALAGRPTGKNLYGYRRIYDPITRRLERVEPDVIDGGGAAVEDSPAAVVREIFERLAAGDTLNSIRLDLQARGIPSPAGTEYWYGQTVRGLARNPSFIGRRIHQGEVLSGVEAMWPPLVDETLFWTVQRILTDPKRTERRPARARYLLSGVIRCAVCGRKLQGNSNRRTSQPNWVGDYICRDQGCVGIGISRMDAFVERIVTMWLSDPDVFAALLSVDDSAATAQARADADRAHVELEQWRKAAETGEITLASFKRVEKGLLARIADAERRTLSMTVPAALRGRIGPHAEEAWYDEQVTPLEIKRQIIAAIADIRVRPVGTGFRYDPAYRVEWRWLMGPGERETIYPPDQRVTTDEMAALAELATNGPISQKELPARVGWGPANDRSTLGKGSAVARRLEQAGLITRTRLPTGRPGRPTLMLELTAAGRQAAAQSRPGRRT
jgi:site-specific DNA recombinase